MQDLKNAYPLIRRYHIPLSIVVVLFLGVGLILTLLQLNTPQNPRSSAQKTQKKVIPVHPVENTPAIITFSASGATKEARAMWGAGKKIIVGVKDSSAWRWQTLPGTVSSNPAITSSSENRLDIFTLRSDNQIQYTYSTDGGMTWEEWQVLSGVVSSAPAVVSRKTGSIDLFARGEQGELLHRTKNGASWTAFSSLDGFVKGAPSAVSLSENHMAVFFRGGDDNLWSKTYQSGKWGEFEELDGYLTAAPSAVVTGDDSLMVFVRGNENKVWFKKLVGKTWDDKNWLSKDGLGGYLKAAPVAYRDGEKITVLGFGGDDQFWKKSLTRGEWSDWEGAGYLQEFMQEPVSLGKVIASMRTDKARYNPGETVKLQVGLDNKSSNQLSGNIVIQLFHLGESTHSQTKAISSLSPGQKQDLSFTLRVPADDFKGYLVVGEVVGNDAVLHDLQVTAVDVSSDWKKFPRYGFVTKFNDTAIIETMKDYHLNSVQFYDWQWQHHRPYSSESSWKNLANMTINKQDIVSLIAKMHDYGMMAMQYNLINGAYDNYWSDGSGIPIAWGLYKNAKGNYNPSHQDKHDGWPSGIWASDKLYLFNPANKGWQDYIIKEEQKVFQHFEFDGWHMDTLGRRGNLWDWNAKPVDLASTYDDFVNAVKPRLNQRIVFNTVGGYGQDEIARTDVDVMYTEMWEGAGIKTYYDIYNLIQRTKKTSNKSVVVAGYMNEAYGTAKSKARQTGLFNQHSVLLANATIFASGGTHIQIGDGSNMPSVVFWPNQPLKMSEPLKVTMRDYYHFLTGYENILLDEVSPYPAMKASIPGVKVSSTGTPGTVWTIQQAKQGYKILHLINFLAHNAQQSQWRDTDANYPAPKTLTNTSLKIRLPYKLKDSAKIYFATPDAQYGKPVSLSFSPRDEGSSTVLQLTLPSLTYWSTIWIEE
jgi:dextranase